MWWGGGRRVGGTAAWVWSLWCWTLQTPGEVFGANQGQISHPETHSVKNQSLVNIISHTLVLLYSYIQESPNYALYDIDKWKAVTSVE